jgi:streptomycin 6-kinase
VDLPARIGACVARWQLRDVSRLSGGFRSEVFGCTRVGGDEVVVKLTVTVEEAAAEEAALRAWAGTGVAVQLIDVDLEFGALLMARIRPATHLPADRDAEAIEVAADLLGRLHALRAGNFAFPGLEQVYARMERRSRDDAAYEQRVSGDPTIGVAGLQHLDAARAAVVKLCASARQTVLLHGDFLAKNLLWNGARYLAIDPIPGLGDPCSDVGFFAAGYPPATTILPRAASMAARMGLDQHRARKWAAIWTVLQTCQAWRADQPDLDACLSSDVFERLLH